eukprot:13553097-Alexandrium_andersonii.AAC.1
MHPFDPDAQSSVVSLDDDGEQPVEGPVPRPVRAAAAPQGPTAEEREQHELSRHSTPAPWCPRCTM